MIHLLFYDILPNEELFLALKKTTYERTNLSLELGIFLWQYILFFLSKYSNNFSQYIICRHMPIAVHIRHSNEMGILILENHLMSSERNILDKSAQIEME